jgi:hypothetical protein
MEPVEAPWQDMFTRVEDSTGRALIVITTVAVPVVQGPAPSGSLEFSVRVTLPAVTSAALGVYTALRVFLLGAKTPVPPVQFPETAEPPIEPFSVAVVPAHICWLLALTVAAGFMVTVTLKVFPVQPPFRGVTV